MKKLIVFIAITLTAAFAGAAQATPDAVVKTVYEIHGADFNGGGDRILDTKSRRNLDKYFEKTLANLLWKHLNADPEKDDIIDFDIFYNAQDADIKQLKVAPAVISGTKATVAVSFKNFGKLQKLTYTLVKSGAAWKISNITYSNLNESLRTIFK